jgi:acetoin utilization deacetylase AcuC-like enzyme
MPEQTAEGNECFSPSAGKPSQVVQSWLNKKLPIGLIPFKPMSREAIAQVHDLAYVNGVLDCKTSNGFGNTVESVAKALPYTTGSMVAAALYSFRSGENSVSPTSGFHHAAWDHGSGFCTFEGLALSVVELLKDGAKKVGILDLDAHFGNTMDIIDRLNLSNRVRHYTFGQHSINPQNAEEWLEKLPEIVCMFSDCDVLLFQAGADPHIEDPLGGSLTSAQMRKRDRIVFACAKKIKVPVAWNLAGGYQSPLRKVLDIHDATIEECLATQGEGNED